MDLLQLESVPATSILSKQSQSKSGNRGKESSRKATEENVHEGGERDEEPGPSSQPQPPMMDTHPNEANSKFPPLRRAAIHFLTLLIRACTARVYDMGPAGMLVPDAYIPRVRMTLGYVASVDEDAVVRVMAREAREVLEQLSNALVGL